MANLNLKTFLVNFRSSGLVAKIRSFLPEWLVNSFWHWPRAFLANLYYRFPSRGLTVIGVTGTDGKTTTCSLIYKILLTAGCRAALISTVAAYFDDEEIPTGLHVTSPDPFTLQNLLQKIKQKGIKYAVLESTSHGLAQSRLWGVNFTVGVVTNITRDHFDYHRTYPRYLAAKAKLFRGVQAAVLNCEDRSFLPLKKTLSSQTQCLTYGLKKGDLNLSNFPFKTSLPGDFNLANSLAAAQACRFLKISDRIIKKGLASFRGVEGRMEKFNEGQPFTAIVDFAHTPNALDQALSVLAKTTTGRLIAVFGAAGLRDRGKRPQMGKIARWADLAVLTAEDPRTENLSEIIEQIAGGCRASGAREVNSGVAFKKPSFIRVADRGEAVSFAVRIARPGDTVVVCGKGHEQSMCFGHTEKSWSDRQALRSALLSLKNVPSK